MKNLFKILLLTSFAIIGNACTDLEEELIGDYTSDAGDPAARKNNSPNVNKATPADGLGPAFGRLFDGTANHGSYFSISEISSDEAVITQKGGDWYDGGIWLDMHKHEWQSTNDGFSTAWNDIYGGIGQCNNLLGQTQTAEATAQLRTLRAYFYWRLLDLFGNVKITTSATDVPQSTRAEVYAFVESELLAAIPDLLDVKQAYGRVNKAGAYALLSRLYLNAEVYTGTAEWQKAIDAADMVINSGLYELDADYAAVFAPDNVENIEHIWVVPFDQATGSNMNFAQMTLHYPSQLTYDLAEQPWNGYSTLEEFYNSYEAGDLRKANNFIAGPQYDYSTGLPILDLAFDPDDPDGAPINYTPAINMLAPSGSRQAGARLGKFSFKIGQRANMDNDYPLLRYGEVLLNKAEALTRLNGYGDAGALLLVNQLRTRAGVSSFGTLTEVDLIGERGRELFMESLRRTDLIRFGKWGDAWWQKPGHSNANLNLFPIPNAAIQAATGEPLTQNPGY
ncbi:MAG: RagB/SusD family nutrient uptake outer membrane protein [Cyclobacteriaceae bacterium]|nr:RagB/SusD family nutrient uptake outer membrane protein [Cyclobacteriaceae bacterium]